MPSRWASRGDSSATLAPENGLRPPIVTSARPSACGRAHQRDLTVFASPWLSTVEARTVPPIAWVASR